MAMTYDERSALAVEAGGSMAEGAGGIAVMVLSIIGLTQASSAGVLAAIAVIVFGAALIIEGGALAAEFSRLVKMDSGGTAGRIEIGGGMSLELLGGVTLVALGVLGLLGFAPATLVAVAVITAGALMILTSGTLVELNMFRMHPTEAGAENRDLMKAGISATVGVQVLSGAAAVVLGILALQSATASLIMSQIGLLVLGSALTISAGTLTGSLMRMFAQSH